MFLSSAGFLLHMNDGRRDDFFFVWFLFIPNPTAATPQSPAHTSETPKERLPLASEKVYVHNNTICIMYSRRLDEMQPLSFSLACNLLALFEAEQSKRTHRLQLNPPNHTQTVFGVLQHLTCQSCQSAVGERNEWPVLMRGNLFFFVPGGNTGSSKHSIWSSRLAIELSLLKASATSECTFSGRWGNLRKDEDTERRLCGTNRGYSWERR